jgi:hypothetical protein
MIRELKREGCRKCGIKPGNGVKLEFHHMTSKQFNIANAVSDFRISKHKLQSELKKCVVLCHDCHTKLHNGEMLEAVVVQ